MLWQADGSRPEKREWASYATADACWNHGSALTAVDRRSSRAHLTSAVAPENRSVSYASRAEGRGRLLRRARRARAGNPIKPGPGDRRFREGDLPKVHSRVGIYRDERAGGDARVYFGAYTVGTTRAVVEAAAFGGGRP